jgi:predicted NACHT family NTPase
LKKGGKVSIAQLWWQLTRNTPVAVIQGYPGMGKSTLMARLTLHMARCGTNQPDPSMGNQLETSRSSPLPILLLLKDYAIELEKAMAMSADLPLINYLQIAIDRLHIPGLFAFIQTCLEKGRCLIMLDGLDEVSELQTRKRVKQAIETFILDYRDTSQTGFNRFLITSRVAGYDVIAFSDRNGL